MLAAAGPGVSLASVLAAGSAAASKGMQATRDMIARKGRARFLGEKSVGYIDPGAASFSMFIEALAQEIQKMGES
jgi:dihydroxyacetone kinase-like protein